MLTSSTRYAVVESDGWIARTGECETHMVDAQAADGQAVQRDVPSTIKEGLHRWDFAQRAWVNLPPRPSLPHYWRNGAWHVYPEKPGSFCEFDYDSGQWVDPRSAADIQAARSRARAAAVLPKSNFFSLMLDYGFLDEDEVLIASGGNFPPRIEAILDAASEGLFPPRARTEALLKLRGDTEFGRMNPFIQLLGLLLDVPEDLMDEIFGVVFPD